MKFEKLGLSRDIASVLKNQDIYDPTEIQEKSIPLVLEGKDVIARSSTGSGKTLAFASAIIHFVKPRSRLSALVLVPTRELAEQVKDAIKSYSHLRVSAVYGGVSMEPQIRSFSKTDVIVSTPGRLLDHLRQGNISFSTIKILVLDEADRMLDMGFIDDIRKIISQCPKDRQTLLFSATMPAPIRKLAKEYMTDPIYVEAKHYVDNTKMEQIYYNVPDSIKFSLLVHLLKVEKGLSMVFCNTRNNVEFVARNLENNGIKAYSIHGGLTQKKRLDALNGFNNKKRNVLVCTDVAARGLDIKDVSSIYNYDIPNDTKEYIHRIGRTARAGENGRVINILSKRDHDNFSRILNAHRNFDILSKRYPKVERARIEITDNRRKNFRRNNHGRRRR